MIPVNFDIRGMFASMDWTVWTPWERLLACKPTRYERVPYYFKRIHLLSLPRLRTQNSKFKSTMANAHVGNKGDFEMLCILQRGSKIKTQREPRDTSKSQDVGNFKTSQYEAKSSYTLALNLDYRVFSHRNPPLLVFIGN